MSQNRKSIISETSIVRAVESQVSCELREEIVVLEFSSGVYYGLNEVGARVWKLIQQPMILRDIRHVILSEYDVEPDECERDLLKLLRDMLRAGLISVRAGTAS